MSTPHVLVVDDESDIHALIQEILSDEGYEVTVAADARQARAAKAEAHHDLVLLDVWMPDTDGITLLREWSEQGTLDCPVVIMSGHGTVDTAVEATRLGAFDFIEKPLSLAKLLRTVERALESGKSQLPGSRNLLPSLIAPVGRSKRMQALREQVHEVAARDSNVLISGESGTGRGAFAQYLHSTSSRSEAPLVELVAASLTDENAEHLLFGSDQEGNAHLGYLDQAKGGTLFVDELADLTDSAQKLLLSAIEQGSYIRRAGNRPVELKARVVGSVQANYEKLINDGQLRRQLVTGLGPLSLRVPPLRDYAEDVPELLRYYVDKLVDGEGLRFRRFGVAAQNRLRNYPWPHNVRELKNLVHRLLIQGGEEEVSLAEIEAELNAETPADEPLVKQDLLALPLREAREQFERAYLQQQLVLCDGKVGKLAKRVGMERTHLYRKLRSLGVEFRQTQSDD